MTDSSGEVAVDASSAWRSHIAIGRHGAWRVETETAIYELDLDHRLAPHLLLGRVQQRLPVKPPRHQPRQIHHLVHRMPQRAVHLVRVVAHPDPDEQPPTHADHDPPPLSPVAAGNPTTPPKAPN